MADIFCTASVRPWPARAAGYSSSALFCYCHRIGPDKARGWSRTATRIDRSAAETKGTKRDIVAGSALSRRPNTRLQRTRPLLRVWVTLEVFGWGLAAEAGALDPFRL